MVAILLVGLPALAAGCAFDSQIAVQFSLESPAVVKESFKPEQVPHRVHGVTMRDGQVVGIDCSLTIVYDINEATGSAVLVQRLLVHLRTRPLPRGTGYALDCTGPLVVELPADASAVQATATSVSGDELVLPLQAPVGSVTLAFGKRLRAEPETQLALVRWPPSLARGDYRVELAFGLPEARAIREKAVATASVSCGRSRYLQPILPAVASMARVPAFAIQPSANPISFSVPRIAGGIGSQAEATRTLSCVR